MFLECKAAMENKCCFRVVFSPILVSFYIIYFQIIYLTCIWVPTTARWCSLAISQQKRNLLSRCLHCECAVLLCTHCTWLCVWVCDDVFTLHLVISLMVKPNCATHALHLTNEVRLNFPWHLLFSHYREPVEFPSELQIKLLTLI